MPSFWKSTVNGLSSFADSLSDTFNLTGPISESANANPDDVLKTKKALSAVGAYPEPKNGAYSDIPDRQTIDGLKQVQKQNGLKVDGIMKPNGPTAKVIGQELSAQGISLAQTNQPPKAPASRNATASVKFRTAQNTVTYNQMNDAYDKKSGHHYKTDDQGNYYDISGTVTPVPRAIRHRLDEKHLSPDALSPEAVSEIGHHMGRQYPQNPKNKNHQQGTKQALESTYTEAEQNRIKTYMKENPQPAMPEGHNSWRGSVQDMGKVMNLDQELLEKAGQDAIPAMAGVLAYNYLDSPESKRAALMSVAELEKKGHQKLALKMRGEIITGKTQGKWNIASLNDNDLKQHLEDQKKLENFFSFASSLPFLPKNIAVALKLAELNFHENQKTTQKEIKRRQ